MYICRLSNPSCSCFNNNKRTYSSKLRYNSQFLLILGCFNRYKRFKLLGHPLNLIGETLQRISNGMCLRRNLSKYLISSKIQKILLKISNGTCWSHQNHPTLGSIFSWWVINELKIDYIWSDLRHLPGGLHSSVVPYKSK